MKRTFCIIITLLLIATQLTGCGNKAAASPDPAIPAETYPIPLLTIGTTGVIESAIRGEYNYDMLSSAVTELPLVYQDTDGSYHPLLADYVTEDALTWTYTVLHGMVWDDGEPVTAEDILFTLEYDEANGTAVFHDKTDGEGNVTRAKYTGYALSDDRMRISLTLAEPNVRELSNMTSFRVMPKHVYEGKDTVTEAEARIGCGPYVFSAFNKEAGTISFTANPAYPRQPNVGKIVYQLFGSEDTMYMALQNGDVDVVWNYSAGVPASYAEVLGDTVTLETVPAVNEPAVLAFNNSVGFFADETLRTAVSYALDYAQFREYFGSAGAAASNRGFVPGTTFGYVETEPLVRDLAQADALMARAGYQTKNAEGFFVSSTGAEAAFALTYNTDKEAHAGYAELLKTQLEAFGIRVLLDGVDKDTFNAKTSNKFSGSHVTMEAAVFSYTAAGMGMVNGLGSIYVDGSHAVQGGCQVFDPAFTGVMAELSAAATPEDYCKGAARLQQYYADHTPLLALYWDHLIYAHRAGLNDLTVDCVFGLNNVNNWFTITEE